MYLNHFEKASEIPVSARELFLWHVRPGAFERLSPPWQAVGLVDPGRGVCNGSRVRFEIRKGPFKISWVAEHREVREGAGFEDVQLRGPFAVWRHRHEFEPAVLGGSRLRDCIDYAVPGGRFVQGLARVPVTRELARMFGYRHRVTAGDLDNHRRYSIGAMPLRVGLFDSCTRFGRVLQCFLQTGGHRVLRMTMKEALSPGDAQASTGSTLDQVTGALEDCDAVVLLADGRMQRAAEMLIQCLRRQVMQPEVLIIVSPLGFGSVREEGLLTEGVAVAGSYDAAEGEAWRQLMTLAEVGEGMGVRVAWLQLGMVLSPALGVLRYLGPRFRMGLGGCVGTGDQIHSWIALDDSVAALLHVLRTSALSGSVHVVSPFPVSNRDLTLTLAATLRRPAILSYDAEEFSRRLDPASGAALAGSWRALPGRLEKTDFRFLYPQLDEALQHVFGTTESSA